MILTMARLLFLLIVPLGFIISCDLEVPIKEMTQAKSAITKARLVMADKYDPEDLNKSQEQLVKCHDLLLAKKGADAKQAANASRDLAVKAMNASLPRAAEDTLAEAKAAYLEADKLYAEHFAKEQFSRAKKILDDAESLKNEKNLMESFLKSRDAKKAAIEAKETCLTKVPQLDDFIEKLKAEIVELDKQNLGESLNHELAAVSTKLDRAALLVAQNDVKQAAPLISQSENTLNTIKDGLKKQSLKERIARLRKDVETLKKERGGEVAAEDLAGVVAVINEADSFLEQDKTEEAFDKVLEAEKYLEIVKNKSLKVGAYAKWESVGKLIETAKKKDTGNKLQEEISTASLLHSDSKDLLDNEYYREGLEKLNEAESLLNSMGIVMEKGMMKKEGAIKSLEGKRTYKVVYNRTNRDCLWRIAQKVYKQARLWPLIYSANKDQIKDPDLIFPGQTFVIPDIPPKKEAEPKEKKVEKDDAEKAKPEGEKKESSEIDEKPREG
jgi:nucleoid-associated protein YgaU